MRSIISFVKRRYPFVILTMMMVLMVEFLDRGSVRMVASWVYRHPNEFILNLLIVFSLFFIALLLIGRTAWAFIATSVVLLTASMISGIKFRILGVPLLPWDLVLTSETKDITQYMNGLFSKQMIMGFGAYLLLSIVLIWKAPHFRSRVNWIERIVYTALAALILVSIYSDKPVNVKTAMEISTIPWDQAENYLTNGFLLSTLLNADLVIIDKPPGYEEERINQLADSIPRRTNIDKTVNPNVIVVLSESFWDPTKLSNVTFNKDPLPFFHSLQEKYSSGQMLSPQFGGGTANVEFEVLTGNSMRFLPQGSLAYIQYVNHGVDSMASILARQGYTSTSINPFHNWFFNSRKVYENLGFSKFISSEFFDAPNKGMFISDSEVAGQIINQSKLTPGPDFIFANTMENHAPYEAWKFNEHDFEVSGDIPADSKEMIEALAQGVHNAELSLKMLVDHFTETKEPTIVVFFGDHLPFLGNDYKAYRDAKYITDNDPQFLDKMFSTPVVVWNNYLPEGRDNLNISPSFLGPYVLNLAQKEGTYYTDYLMSLSKKIPVIPPKNHFEARNINEQDLLDYEAMQYDVLFGKQYGYGELASKIVNPSYTLGYGPMSVDSVVPAQIESGSHGLVSLKVSGINLVPECVGYLNGKAVPTEWNSDRTLTVTVPRDMADKPGPWTLQLKVADSKKIVIAESNNVQVTSLK